MILLRVKAKTRRRIGNQTRRRTQSVTNCNGHSKQRYQQHEKITKKSNQYSFQTNT
jgi:hypothetical protein